MTTETHYFRIAELNLAITFHQPHTENMGLIPSLEPFRTDAAPDVMFHLSVDANTTPVTADDCERIRVFDTGNGDTVVDRLCNGGYQYLVKDTNGSDCCLLRTDKHFKDCRCALFGSYDMRSFGLNNASCSFLLSLPATMKRCFSMHRWSDVQDVAMLSLPRAARERARK